MKTRMRSASWLIMLTVGLGLTLAACNTATPSSTTAPGATSPSLSITSSTTASSGTYHLTGTTSNGATKVTYTVGSGTTKTVSLSGTAFDITITLNEGDNTITVTVYDAAGHKTTKTIKVSYPAGNLSIAFSGLPSGVKGNVLVTGPNSYSKTVTAGTTLNNLPDGTYTLTPKVVSNGTYPWDAPTSSVAVQTNTTQNGKVKYAESGGAMKVAFTGPLPTGTNYSATITGNGLTRTATANYNNALTVTTMVPNLPAGSYKVTAPTYTTCQKILGGGILSKWEPAIVPASPATIVIGATRLETITYAPVPSGTC